MPQGGIDEGEDPPAAPRELHEETNIRSAEHLAEVAGLAHLRHPARPRRQAWKESYRGQTQKWFAFRFTGEESEIDILSPAGGHKPEFVAWRWDG